LHLTSRSDYRQACHAQFCCEANLYGFEDPGQWITGSTAVGGQGETRKEYIVIIESVSEQGSRFAVRLDRVSAIREKGKMSWACVDGQWLGVNMPFDELVKAWREAVQEARA
jgi:hypothetical protein